MKGFTYTLESALGTILVIALILTSFNLQEDRFTDPTLGSIDRQLNQLQSTGLLSEAATQKEPRLLDQKIDSTPLRHDSKIETDELIKSSNESSEFSVEYNFTEDHVKAIIYIWTEGQEITVNKNSEQIYRGSADFKPLDITSESETGKNKLDITNLAEDRVGYLVALSREFGSDSPESRNVRVYSRITFPENSQNLSTIKTFVWR